MTDAIAVSTPSSPHHGLKILFTYKDSRFLRQKAESKTKMNLKHPDIPNINSQETVRSY